MIWMSPKLYIDITIRCCRYEGHPVRVCDRGDSGPVAVRELAKLSPGIETEESAGRPVLLLYLALALTLQH